MISNLNAKQLAILYNMGYSTFQKYLTPHRDQLKNLATKRYGSYGEIIRSRNFNSYQLKYIVEKIMGDAPEGYVFDGKLFNKR